MRLSLLIVGAGRLGSRHLQGLAKCKVPLAIFVIDPSVDALARAKIRWDQAAANVSMHAVHFGESLTSVPPSIDLAVVATSAGGRAAIIENIARRVEVKAWMLEKILAQSEAEFDIIVSSVGKNDRVWVNVPRRTMAWYQTLKSATSARSPAMATITGGGWGLSCNAVHFLDLAAWWSGETLAEVDTSKLEGPWFESKRAGYWEVNGTLQARFSAGSTVFLTCDRNPAPVIITLSGPDGTWTIRESENMAKRSDGRLLPGRIEFQSEMTGLIAEEILQTGRCALPSLAESVALHRPLLRSLLAHWNATMPNQLSKVPIT